VIHKLSDSGDILLTIQKIIAHQLKIKPSEALPQAHIQKDLGAESLDAMEIIMNIEEAFDIDIPDEQARKVQTVQDITAYVEALVKKT
jgi:acyl carrier protein